MDQVSLTFVAGAFREVRRWGHEHPVDPALDDVPEPGHPENEPHSDSLGGRLNALRAAVLGANDGIVSVAAIVMGFAGATPTGS